MSETEMTLRVARAIRAKVPLGYGMTGAEAVEYARAAIEEMREPTDAMIDAGVKAETGKTLGSRVVHSHRAMIDAALK